MAKELFDSWDDMSLVDLGRINDEGYVEPEPPDHSDWVFQDQFERRAIEKTRQKPSLPVHDSEPRTGPWSGNNNLGVEVAFAPDTNNRQTILKLPEWGFPTVWSIMLGLAFTEQAGNFFEITALINAGGGGVTQEIEVDWVTGAVLNVPMNAVNIIASYAINNSVPPDLLLRVNIARRPIPGANATRTIRISATAGNFSDVIRIPPFTKAVYIIPNSSTVAATLYAATSILRFSSSITGGAIAELLGSQILSFSSGVPLCRGARYLLWFNGNAPGPGSTQTMEVVFVIGL